MIDRMLDYIESLPKRWQAFVWAVWLPGCLFVAWLITGFGNHLFAR